MSPTLCWWALLLCPAGRCRPRDLCSAAQGRAVSLCCHSWAAKKFLLLLFCFYFFIFFFCKKKRKVSIPSPCPLQREAESLSEEAPTLFPCLLGCFVHWGETAPDFQCRGLAVGADGHSPCSQLQISSLVCRPGQDGAGRAGAMLAQFFVCH